MSGYGVAQQLYLEAGWPGVLPLRRGQKDPPPKGYTGNGAPDPDDEQLAVWRKGYPDGNRCLRMPGGIVGIDVDAYNGGAETLATLEAKLGKLPDTVWSSARAWPSGIRYYRVPQGRKWRNPGPGIQIVHRGWRYTVVWPSLHPTLGTTYGWHGCNGSLPKPDEFPLLPDAWVSELDAGGGQGSGRGRLRR